MALRPLLRRSTIASMMVEHATAPSPHDLVVSCAGRDWLVRAGLEGVRDELAAWLGPWARSPGADESPFAGSITMIAGGPGGFTPGVRRAAAGLHITEKCYDILVTTRDGTEHAVARYAGGYHATVARTALRILAARLVLAEGGVPLHASSVKTPRGALVFAGPSGVGKTSAAEAFPASDRLDPDLVLVAEEAGRSSPAGRWVRLDLFDEYEPRRFVPGTGAGLPVRAVLFPEPGPEFELRPLRGAEAVRRCLHLPAGVSLPDGRGGPDARAVSKGLARVESLTAAVPVARFRWSLSDDLPALLEGILSR